MGKFGMPKCGKATDLQCLLLAESVPGSKTDPSSAGEESLTIFLDKQKLNKKSEGSSNSSVVSLELLHQLAASYFTDRESTLRRLHHLQIATSAIKVMLRCMQVARCQVLNMSTAQFLLSGSVGKMSFSPLGKFTVIVGFFFPAACWHVFKMGGCLCASTNSHPSWPTCKH